MRILVDAMCSEYGGIATYVNNLLATWPDIFPDDEIHVLAPEGTSVPDRGVTVHRQALRRPVAVFRPLWQTVRLHALTRRLDVDAVLATLPATTVLRPGRPVAVVVYDLRHELRPEQFPPRRRLLRLVSYRRGYAIADAFISISQRSLDDLHDRHPRTTRVPGVVAHLAADHVAGWRRTDAAPYAVAFGHHTNKNTDLVIDAWERLARDPDTPAPPTLRIIGLPGVERARVSALLADRGLTDVVEVAPFLPDAEFESVLASTSLVVFPSDFEGFGLPVLEAMRLGVPVVVGPDRAVLEIAGGHATVMDGWTVDALVDAVRRGLATDAPAVRAAAEHAARFTWAATVRRTRAALELITAQRPAVAR